MNKKMKEFKIAAESIKIEDKKEICPPDVAAAIKELYATRPELQSTPFKHERDESWDYRPDEPWIQTYTGRRFNSTNPIPAAIAIEDIAHALSMQCRFSGHVNSFYSVAQHSVLVSYICDSADALAGLLHDASEAYLVDIPRPIKKSGKFDNYLEFEVRVEKAIAEKFGVPPKMPDSVRIADDLLLATEARDFMTPLRHDWIQVAEPLPFKICPWSQPEAKELFIKRYCQLTGLTREQILEKSIK